MDIQELLVLAGRKNEVIDEDLPLEKALKAIESEKIADSGVSFRKIRDAILGLGKILEENQEEQYYLTTVDVGLSAAILLARESGGAVEVASYADEGIIRRHLARKAIETFKNRLASLHSYSTPVDK